MYGQESEQYFETNSWKAPEEHITPNVQGMEWGIRQLSPNVILMCIIG
jgi:hypothetical protein